MTTVQDQRADEAPIAAPGSVARLDWARVFRLMMKALAVITLARGLFQWAVICGWPNADGITFEDFAPGLQAAIVFFAVIEPVAGVGLWLAAAWGGVVWILAVIVALAIDLAVLWGTQGWVQAAARPVTATAADLALLGIYILVATAASRQADEPAAQ
jgi:hypothetical protein